MSTPEFTTVGLVGTGAMGRGIAQIAAQAGAVVRLFDTQPDAVAKAQAALGAQWDKLLEKGKLTAEEAYKGLMDAGYIVRWLPGQKLGHGLRISVGAEEETQGLVAALRAIVEAKG